MPFPTNWTKVTVTGKYIDLDGNPLTGTVSFVPANVPALVDAGLLTVIFPKTLQATLDSNGAFSIQLPATNDPDIAPTGFTYTVNETFGNYYRTYSISVPYDSAPLDISTILPVIPASLLVSGSVNGALSVNGLTVGGFAQPLVQPVSRGHAWRGASFSEQLQSGHSWTAGGAGLGSSNLNDTANYVRGTQSATITTSGAGTQAQLRRLGLSALNLTGKAVRVILKVDDVTHLNRLEFVIGSSSLANFFKWILHTHSGVNPNWVRSGEWVVITFSWADVASAAGTYSIAANGAPSTKTGFTDLQLNVFDDGAQGVTTHLQAVEVIPDITPTFAGGLVSVVVDDAWQSFYDLARPKMDALGYRGTQYVISDYVGTSGRLTLAELSSLQTHSGWEIAGHAYTNAAHGQANGYADLTSAAVDAELRNLRAWLVVNGFNGDSFAYPKGSFGLTTDNVPIESLVARYFSSGRSINFDNAEMVAPPMRYRLRAKTGISEVATTPASVVATGGILDRCQLQGDWLILVFHQVVASGADASDKVTQAGFNTVMDGIASRSIPVLPVSEVMRFYS
jgi:hypothetical protein